MKHVVNGLSYLANDETENLATSFSEFVVMRLLEPYAMKGKTVTTDNIVTNGSLASKLLAKKTTLVGTVRSEPLKNLHGKEE